MMEEFDKAGEKILVDAMCKISTDDNTLEFGSLDKPNEFGAITLISTPDGSYIIMGVPLSYGDLKDADVRTHLEMLYNLAKEGV